MDPVTSAATSTATPAAARKSVWWLWLLAAGSVVLLLMLASAAVALHWWPAAVMRHVPTPGMVIQVAAMMGWDDRGQQAASAGCERLEGFSAEVCDAALLSAIAGDGRGRLAAMRLIERGYPTGGRTDARVKEQRERLMAALRIHLDAPEPVLRTAARAAYHVLAGPVELRWLVRQQQADGSWPAGQAALSPSSHCPDRVGVSSLSVLAFLGEGYDHKTPNEFKHPVQAGLAALVAHQQDDGRFSSDPRGHALGLFAVAEAYAMTADADLKMPAKRALSVLLSAMEQQRQASWDEDTLLAMLQVMALKSVLAGGLIIDEGTSGFQALPTSKSALLACWRKENPAAGSPVRFPWYDHGRSVPGADADGLAAALLGMVFLGCHAGVPNMDAIAPAWLRARRADACPPLTGWLATMGIFQSGGAPWQSWQRSFTSVLSDALVFSDDASDGSWRSTSDHASLDCAAGACRLLSTEVFYRYRQIDGIP